MIRALSFLLAVGAMISVQACGGAAPRKSEPAPTQPAPSQTTLYTARDLAKVNVFVSPRAKTRTYKKVAVIPFQASQEMAGASMAEMFTTELLKTYKYQLIERGQIEKVLGEQSPGSKGATESDLAIRVGKILGVQGVIVGAVPDYHLRFSGNVQLPAVGLKARMIDVADGTVVWSVANSGVAQSPVSLSFYAETRVKSALERLRQEWLRVGDTLAANLPVPDVLSAEGALRSATIKVNSDRNFVTYNLSRSRSKDGRYQRVSSMPNTGNYLTIEDAGLEDGATYFYKISGVAGNGFRGPETGPLEVATAGPPGKVEGFEARSGSIREVPLSWSPLQDRHLKGYRILRRQHGGKWRELKTFDDPARAGYVDRRLDDDGSYEYRIVAFNIAGAEGPPATAVAVTKGPPAAVRNFRAEGANPRRIPLSWDPVNEPEVKGYVIHRAGSRSGSFKKLKDIEGKETAAYVDEEGEGGWSAAAGLEDGREYFYFIRSVNIVDVESGNSPTVSARTKPVPAPVGRLEAESGRAREVILRWKINPEPDIDRYEVYRGGKEGAVTDKLADLTAGKKEYADEELKNGTDYYYRMRAVDKDGLIGEYSPVVHARTKPVPEKPKGLRAAQEGRTLTLMWEANPEKDVARYVIYQESFLSAKILGEEAKPPFICTVEKDGTYRFRIRAVDIDGLESEKSDEIVLKVESPK